jgi:putative peptidoglycan lipid II flippase
VAGSEFRKVGVASLIMMSSVFLSRVIGLVREQVIAFVRGAGGEVDAYQLAFVLPEILNHIAASGFLSITFIPIFSHYLAEGREEEGWRVFSIILTVFGFGLALLLLLCEWQTPVLINLLAAGISDPDKLAAVTRMTRIVLPAQFFFFTGGLFMAVQFAKERFFVPALTPLVYNAGIIAGGLLLGPYMGMEGFCWGALAGAGAGAFLLQIAGALREKMRYTPLFRFRHPEVRRFVLLSLPLMVGLTMFFSTEVLFKVFGAYLSAGSIASLNYALRVMLILVGLFGQAAGMASYPYLVQLAVAGRLDEMNRLLNTTLRYIALIIPFSVMLMATRHEVIRILFERGQFGQADTERTAGVMLFLLAGAGAFSAQTVVVRGFYALQDTLTPALCGSLAVLFCLPVYWLGMQVMGGGGIALAVSFSALLQVAALYLLWSRRSHNSGAREVMRYYLMTALLCLPLGGFLELLRRLLLTGIDNTTFVGSLAICLVVGIVFLAVFLFIGVRFDIREINDLFGRVRARLRRRSAE